MTRWSAARLRLVLTLMVLTIMIAGSCAVDNSSVRHFATTDGFAKYQFSYSPKYKLVDHSYDDLGSSVRLEIYPHKADTSSIVVFAWRPDKSIPNAESRVAILLRRMKNQPESKILEQSTIVVDGKSALDIVYLRSDLTPIKRPSGPPLERHHEVNFDYGGIIWSIQQITVQAYTESDKADFDLVLSTFKVLD